jgi:Tfp pilus assembly protein PilF
VERIEKLKEFLKTDPSDSFLKHALALEYIKIGNDSDAKKLFESVIVNDPHYVGTYYHFARLLERNGDKQGAIKVYEQGMEETKLAGDNHAYGELKTAYEDLI